MVDKDSTGVNEELSWLRRRGEANGACFFASTAVIDGYDATSRITSSSVLGEVSVGAPEPDFLFGIIPGGNIAAHQFN